MVVADRTDEFFQIAERLTAAGQSSQPGYIRPPGAQGGVAQQSQLNVAAASIGTELNITSLKLQELSQLVKHRGIFNDKTAKIQELTFDIQKRITDLKTHVEIIDNKVREATAINPHFRAHHTNMVETLKTRLLEATKEFQDLLTLRTEMMKKQDNRRNMYSFSAGMASKQGVEMDIESGQQQEMQMMDRGSAYFHSRAEAVESVQKAIAELAQIFQKVATMVTQQEEMVQRIDQDVDSSARNMNQGQSELLRYYNSISSNRTLILKVFGVVLFFILFFIIFLA